MGSGARGGVAEAPHGWELVHGLPPHHSHTGMPTDSHLNLIPSTTSVTIGPAFTCTHILSSSSGVPPPQTLVQYNNIITVRQAELAFMLRRLPSFIKRQVGAELGEDSPLSSSKVAEGWCTRAELHFIL